jgi:hypothetical protein
MQTLPDRDATVLTPPVEPLPHAPDADDPADLWRDLGGGG